MNFLFDLDDVLVRGDTVAVVSKKLEQEGKLDRHWTSADCKTYGLGDLPPVLKAAMIDAYMDPRWVWSRIPIVGAHSTLLGLESLGHNVGLATARNVNLHEDTLKYVRINFPFVQWKLGVHFCDVKFTGRRGICGLIMPSKQEIMIRTETDCFIDDNLDYCKEATDCGISCILISNAETPWNWNHNGICSLSSVAELPLHLFGRSWSMVTPDSKG